MKKLEIYADTSVFGGCFDEEFAVDSNRLFSEISDGRMTLLISGITLLEIGNAPETVQQVLTSLPAECVRKIPENPEILDLRDAYLDAGIVGRASRLDAEHIATATVGGADLLVSWNFRHIVHYDKIAGYQGINILKGYKPIRIHTPREVVSHEEDL